MEGHPYDLPLQGVCVDCSLSKQECVSEAAVTWDERGSYWLTPLPTSCGRNWKVLWRHKRLEALWALDWKVGFSLTTEPFSWKGVFYDHSFCKTRLQYRKKHWLQRSQVAWVFPPFSLRPLQEPDRDGLLSRENCSTFRVAVVLFLLSVAWREMFWWCCFVLPIFLPICPLWRREVLC